MVNYVDSTSPRISVGLPVFNGERYLAATLESILAQTYADFELIISDNGSTDATQRICAVYAAQDSRIAYHRHDENRGAAFNFNFVFGLARGPFFKWAAYDDLLAPTFLERCLEVLEREDAVVLTYPQTNRIDAEGQFMEHYADGLDLREPTAPGRFRKFLATPGHCHPVFGLIRTDILRQTPLIGKYPGSDRNLIGEIALRGQIAEIPEYLFYRRHHPDISFTIEKTQSEIAEWFDPASKGRLIFPHGRRFIEYFKSIQRVPMSWADRIHCGVLVGRFALYPKRWMGIGDDIQTVVKKSLRFVTNFHPNSRQQLQ
jgi:glycosyltransferase involved in cell wall biosynthesis